MRKRWESPNNQTENLLFYLEKTAGEILNNKEINRRPDEKSFNDVFDIGEIKEDLLVIEKI